MARTGTGTVRRLVRGRDDTRIRATWRVLAAFVVSGVVWPLITELLRVLPIPDPLVGIQGTVAAFATLGAVLFVASNWLDQRPIRAYGLEFDREWWRDFVAALVVGVLFHAFTTLVLLGGGSGRVVGTLSSGAAEGMWPILGTFVVSVAWFVALGALDAVLLRAVVVLNAVEGLVARGATARAAVGLAWLISTLLSALPQAATVVSGPRPSGFVGLQAVFLGGALALAYVLTGSLAFPVGLHLSTNLYTTYIVGPAFDPIFAPGPALVRLERNVRGAWELLWTIGVPLVVLVWMIVAWVRATRGSVSAADALYRLSSPRT